MEEKKKCEWLSKHYIVIYIVYLLSLFLFWYFWLPFLNFRDISFYFYLMLVLAFPVAIIYAIIKKRYQKNDKNTKYTTYRFNKRTGKFEKVFKDITDKYQTNHLIMRGIFLVVCIFLGIIILFNLTGLKIFNAKAYANQLEIKQGNSEDLNTIFDYDSGEVLLPRIDKDLAFRLAEARLDEYGSQYSIDYDNFTLISVNRNDKTELIRVTPLEYATPFVALSRGDKGTIGYIEVNVITQEAKLVAYPDGEGLKYMPSAIFGKDLDRHIRTNYPTLMYNDKYFEIDNDGNPYWVIPTIKKEIGVFSGETPNGVLVVDPRSGKMTHYALNDNHKPDWLQRAVDEAVVAKQADNALTYKNGFWNTLFAKKEVFQLSDGYNYFIKDGNTYYVSCITSPNSNDQTSIGFITINLKTKESIRYSNPGITEMRAREIAQNDERVKAQNLDSTWPILITYHKVPTYFVVLKNDVLSQKIVLINVEDGTLVAMGDTLEAAKQEYELLLANKGIISSGNEEKETVTVSRIRDLGNKIQFMVEEHQNVYFEVDVNLCLDARFLQVGDKIDITYKENLGYNLVLLLEKISE